MTCHPASSNRRDYHDRRTHHTRRRLRNAAASDQRALAAGFRNSWTVRLGDQEKWSDPAIPIHLTLVPLSFRLRGCDKIVNRSQHHSLVITSTKCNCSPVNLSKAPCPHLISSTAFLIAPEAQAAAGYAIGEFTIVPTSDALQSAAFACPSSIRSRFDSFHRSQLNAASHVPCTARSRFHGFRIDTLETIFRVIPILSIAKRGTLLPDVDWGRQGKGLALQVLDFL